MTTRTPHVHSIVHLVFWITTKVFKRHNLSYKLVAPLGFEPRQERPKLSVLPLHHRALSLAAYIPRHSRNRACSRDVNILLDLIKHELVRELFLS